MIETLLTSLEASQTASMLRSSLWIYPAVNAGHIIGIALLLGGVVPLDLRLLGLWADTPLAPLLQVLMKTVFWGVVLTVVCGFLLFITRASSYSGSTLFVIKMIFVGAGLLNGLLLRLALSPNNLPPWVVESHVPITIRLAACFSLLFWVTALILGRLIGYVH